MIQVHYTKKNTPFVIASELHAELEIQEPFEKWFRAMIDYGFKKDYDHWMYIRTIQKPDGQLVSIPEWSVRLDMAKSIAVIQNNEIGRQLRNYLLTLEEQKDNGKLLSLQQVEALMDIAEILGLFSIQTFLEKEHYTQFLLNSKTSDWWDYRAKLFGLKADDIKAIIATYGIKYENQRQALFHIDKFELVSRAAIDLFKLLGKSDQFAKNMGAAAKAFAKRLNVHVYKDTGMSLDFNTEKQRATIDDVRNYKTPSAQLKAF